LPSIIHWRVGGEKVDAGADIDEYGAERHSDRFTIQSDEEGVDRSLDPEGVWRSRPGGVRPAQRASACEGRRTVSALPINLRHDARVESGVSVDSFGLLERGGDHRAVPSR
jgi:hypothetical protein